MHSVTSVSPVSRKLGLALVSHTVKPVLSGHSKGRPKIGFQDRLSLNAGQKYCRMLQESILQYFRPSLSYHLSLRPFLSIFEWPLKTGFTVLRIILGIWYIGISLDSSCNAALRVWKPLCASIMRRTLCPNMSFHKFICRHV